jgi:hypothetical protein
MQVALPEQGLEHDACFIETGARYAAPIAMDVAIADIETDGWRQQARKLPGKGVVDHVVARCRRMLQARGVEGELIHHRRVVKRERAREQPVARDAVRMCGPGRLGVRERERDTKHERADICEDAALSHDPTDACDRAATMRKNPHGTVRKQH